MNFQSNFYDKHLNVHVQCHFENDTIICKLTNTYFQVFFRLFEKKTVSIQKVMDQNSLYEPTDGWS